MLGMNATCACPFLTQHGPLFCPPERRGPRNVERRQDLRPMYDSRDLDAKEGPPWQDSRAMYPKSPDCTPKRIHGTKILPASARKACISRKRCQGGPLFRAISEKRIHGARILPQQPNRPTPRRHSQDHCSWQPEATLKSTCHQDDSRKGTNPRSMKQLARQLSTKDPWRKAACASSFDAHRCRHRRS